ncbi:FCD domain-containing protein [Nocardia uniformis]|uniref:FCD domain-containing protein n=1 Tax=Nocardia uniformis TaxID=53432 RepID=A0A849BUZ8_9NOCA|nr:FCD domain-containing protein [Nocardia uniformis]
MPAIAPNELDPKPLSDKGELTDVAREHHTVLDALESRDADAVERIMGEHIRQARGRWAKPAE